MKKTKDLVIMALFTALTATGAFIRIPLPHIPFTLQTFFVMLAGLLLGAKKGSFSVIAYVLLGLIGIPVFTQGGGIGYVLKPTFGYLVGFCVGAFITGYIANKKSEPSFKRLLTANFAGLAIIYVLGMIYYWIIVTFYVGTGVTLKFLLIYCFAMTIPGDIVLSFLAAIIAKRMMPIMKKWGFLN